MTTAISKGERDELRRIVRGDFKALRQEIDVRQAELVAEIEKRVAQRFMAHEEVIAEAESEILKVVAEANEKVVAILRETQRHCDGYKVLSTSVGAPSIRFVREKREEMRRAMLADLEARVQSAKATMSRQEVDLLKRLSVDALESDEARAFLKDIPSVAELVPASRLAELEAAFSAGDHPDPAPLDVSVFDADPEDGRF